jgi:hypothetical protein
MKILKIGTISVDGSKIKASASIYRSIRYDRAQELETQLTLDIKELLEKAEREDKDKDEKGDEVESELARLTDLRAKMREAQKKLEEQAKERARLEQKEYEDKVRRRNDREGRGKGRHIKEPENTPATTDQVNLTDSDSRIMRKSKRSEYIQGYNAQAVVDAEGTMLVLGARVTNNASDANELVLDIESIPKEIGKPMAVLADSGYASEIPVENIKARGIEVLVSVNEHLPRRHDFRPTREVVPDSSEKPYQKEWIKEMSLKMSGDEARRRYRLRKQTVEPVFGIVKQAMGFRQFLLRGIENVENEWRLVLCAYNLKRLAVLMR